MLLSDVKHPERYQNLNLLIPKRYDEHPRPFHMAAPPPLYQESYKDQMFWTKHAEQPQQEGIDQGACQKWEEGVEGDGKYKDSGKKKRVHPIFTTKYKIVQ